MKSESSDGVFLFDAPELYSALSAHRILLLEGFPLSETTEVDLDLRRFEVTSPEARSLFIDGSDVSELEVEVALYQGSIVGEPESLVYLGTSAGGTVGFVQRGPELFILAAGAATGRGSDAVRQALFDRSVLRRMPSSFRCEVEGAASRPAVPEEPALLAGETRRVRMVIDSDWEYQQLFPSTPDASAYILQLMGAISVIYEGYLDVEVVVVQTIIRGQNDPYAATNTGCVGFGALDELQDHWNGQGGSIGDLTHLLSGKLGPGGCAYVDKLCNESEGYGVSMSIGGSFPWPLTNGDTDNWDLFAVAHEMGHNFGSEHTHCYDPPIDNCGGSTDDCWNGTQTCQDGTLMSYCHTCGSGSLANINLIFHQRVINRIRSSVDSSCLPVLRDPIFVDGSFPGPLHDGTVWRPYLTIAEGVDRVVRGGDVYIYAGTYMESLAVFSRNCNLRSLDGTVRVE